MNYQAPKVCCDVMKRLRYGMFAALLALAVACHDDTEHRLEGKWQLQRMEYGGEVVQADTVFYNFQNRLFMYQIYQPSKDTVIYRHGFNTLENDTQLTIELTTNPYGLGSFMPYTDWQSKIRVFTIETLNGKQLILDGDGKKYVFRKF